MSLINKLENLRAYFDSGATLSADFRIAQLKKLKQSILLHEENLYQALYNDLKKSKEETWVTETGMVISELNTALRKLKSWMRPEKVRTNLLNLPSKSIIIREPLGVVLIIGPWNYPFQLLINPLIGAIAAGNCVVLKPSEFAPATDAVMKKIIEEIFPKEYILYAQGEGQQIIPEMMGAFRFDHVFYTGSTAVGKIIYKMAAEKIVPVTLELGGKSPCVVAADANIKIAAKRIAMTKFSNAGQMCVAPDYVLVHQSIKQKFVDALKETIKEFFSEKPEESYNYGKMINEKQFDRVAKYLSEGTIIIGGRTDRASLFIEPCLLDNVAADAVVMQDEIFGPVLPILTFSEMDEAKSVINKHPNPLAFYIYTTSNAGAKLWLQNISAGGACINNSSWQYMAAPALKCIKAKQTGH